MYRVGNKIVKFGNLIPKSENRTVIELTVRGTSFPDLAAANFSITSNAGNKMNIDFNDGTGVHTYLPNSGTNFIYSGSPIHFFQDLIDPSKIGTIETGYPQERMIKIWFDFPSRVSQILWVNVYLYGLFPANIGNYNLTSLRISAPRYFTGFPARFRGGVFNTLNFILFSPNRFTTFPSWVGNSRIKNLTLQNVFDLSAGSTVTGIDSISGCESLELLTISDNVMTTNESFPSTLKDIPTLRTLFIGNDFVTFPSRVGQCAQVTKLTVSDGTKYATQMTNWGSGIGLMVSLNELIYTNVNASTSNFTTDLPIGIENCILLKTVNFRASFVTLVRINTHIDNWYSLILANASTSSGNTKFRNMTIDAGTAVGPFVNPRPSGGSTPTSVVYPATTQIQKIYNMCKTYGHTWIIRNLANTGIETITPTS